jgi:hypothetical protein
MCEFSSSVASKKYWFPKNHFWAKLSWVWDSDEFFSMVKELASPVTALARNFKLIQCALVPCRAGG